MKIGIIGPPQSGKTTLFKVLLQAESSSNIGVFKCHDERLDKIAEIFSSKKSTHPEFIFVDMGHASGIAKKDLSHLQDVDLFICAIGAFYSEEPAKDLDSCLTDIIISDLEMAQNRINRLSKEHKGAESELEAKALDKCQNILSEGRLLFSAKLDRDGIRALSGLYLLSLKPLIVAVNVSEDNKDSEPSKSRINQLEEYCRLKDIRYIRFFGKTELELLEIAPEERKAFLEGIGPGYNFLQDISRMIIKELNLIIFFTANQNESRGWYLKSGLPAIEAAGKIHSDMKRGFIRAEVVNFNDLEKHGSLHKAKEAGAARVEGKDYIVKEGDVLNIRFNI